MRVRSVIRPVDKSNREIVGEEMIFFGYQRTIEKEQFIDNQQSRDLFFNARSKEDLPIGEQRQLFDRYTSWVRDEKTLRQHTDALALAKALQQLPGICQVGYVGLSSNPFHDLAQRQFGPTAGAMLTIDLESEQKCYDFLNRLKLISRATNLFDNKTLAIHPYSTIFVSYSAAEKAAMDVRPTTIRLSIGLEQVEDLLADIQQAL
jgi:O-acetylhomoserine/O-acetylserine sulfhydrylase-like pyridoxal-dependent enzyme